MPSIAHRRIHNRLFAVMLHIARYTFQGQARLAEDVGTYQMTIHRLLTERCSPSYALALSVLETLEQQLGRRIDPREVMSLDGNFPTASVCTLCGCKGCLPPQVYNARNKIKPQYRHIQPGRWALVPHPSHPAEALVQALPPEPFRESRKPDRLDTSGSSP